MKRALVTGSAQGIGAGIVQELQAQGFHVIGVDCQRENAIKADVFIQSDLSLPESAEVILKALDNQKLDLMVFNAAVQLEKGILESSREEVEKLFAVNLFSIFDLTRTLLPLMKGGSILNISSVHARATSLGLAAYVASKGALSALTRSMAIELGPLGIRVNAICPGAIDTPMLNKGLGRSLSIEESRNKLKLASPLGRIGRAEDVAKLVAFLADDGLSANITGQEFVCDGGVLAKLASE